MIQVNRKRWLAYRNKEFFPCLRFHVACASEGATVIFLTICTPYCRVKVIARCLNSKPEPCNAGALVLYSCGGGRRESSSGSRVAPRPRRFVKRPRVFSRSYQTCPTHANYRLTSLRSPLQTLTLHSSRAEIMHLNGVHSEGKKNLIILYPIRHRMSYIELYR